MRHPNAARLLISTLLIAAPALAQVCTNDKKRTADELIKQEARRQDDLATCAFSLKPEDAAKDPRCQKDWRDLDFAEPTLAGCLTQGQAEKFINSSSRHNNTCGKLQLSGPKAVYDAQCRVNWGWLAPFEAASAKRSNDAFSRSLESVSDVLGYEEARAQNLEECARSSKPLIQQGGLDGVCAATFSYLSSAEAKLADGDKLSEADMRQFAAWRAHEAVSCQTLGAVLRGDEAGNRQLGRLCGADWTWLDRLQAAAAAKRAQRASRAFLGGP